jgi:hypothetical protein
MGTGAVKQVQNLINRAGMVTPQFRRRGHAPTQFLSLEFVEGTPCDLNANKSRSTVVNMYCGSKYVACSFFVLCAVLC